MVTPQAVVFILIVTATHIIYRVQGNRGMSHYLFLLACGTLLRYSLLEYDISEAWITAVVISIVEVRLLTTVFGIISKRYRHNDEFIRSLKYIFGTTIVRIFIVNTDVIDDVNLYLSYKFGLLLYISLYFGIFDPIRILFQKGWWVIKKPYLSREWKMKDSLLTAIGLYSIDFIAFYAYYGSTVLEHWIFHQISSIIFALTLLVIGIVYRIKGKQMDWNSA